MSCTNLARALLIARHGSGAFTACNASACRSGECGYREGEGDSDASYDGDESDVNSDDDTSENSDSDEDGGITHARIVPMKRSAGYSAVLVRLHLSNPMSAFVHTPGAMKDIFELVRSPISSAEQRDKVILLIQCWGQMTLVDNALAVLLKAILMKD